MADVDPRPGPGRQPVAPPRAASLPIVRCVCGQRLFDGYLVGEIKCKSCKRVMKFLAKNEKSD